MAEWNTLIARWLPDENNTDYLAALRSPRSPAGAALTLAMADRSADSLDAVSQYTAFRDKGFAMFMERYKQGLAIEKAAVKYLKA